MPLLIPKRKGWTKLSDTEWRQIKLAYETDPNRPTLESLAIPYGIHASTVHKRAIAESWARQDTLAIKTISRIKNESNAIVDQVTANVTKSLAQQLTDSLEPWIAREKTKHIKSQIRRSKSALAQLDQHIARDKPISPKDSSFVSKTADTWDQIMRRNLGLNDNSPVGGALQLNILTNHSAVQIKPVNKQDQ